MKGDLSKRGFSTRAIHAGQAPDPRTGSVAVPIYQTSTYIHQSLGNHKGYEYARGENVTREALEANVASLERGRSGHAFASGMAAIDTLMTLLSPGDHVVASRTVYGGTFRLFKKVLEPRSGLTFTFVDSSDLGTIAATMTKRTKMVYIETPTNPLMEITDIERAAEIAHENGAILAVDNTFLSPYLQNPLELGADVVVHSTTKYINGHSDSIGGVLVAKSEEHGEWFEFVQKSAGAILSPLDCFLVMRGIKTLPVRMERHESNARAIAKLLNQHPKVSKTLYPGLPDHPGHEIQVRQARGFGGMITFDVGTFEAVERMLNAVEVITLAESLGGVESLISHPASMTHASVPAVERKKVGVDDGLVRVSVGIEDLDDLVRDIEQALDKI